MATLAQDGFIPDDPDAFIPDAPGPTEGPVANFDDGEFIPDPPENQGGAAAPAPPAPMPSKLPGKAPLSFERSPAYTQGQIFNASLEESRSGVFAPSDRGQSTLQPTDVFTRDSLTKSQGQQVAALKDSTFAGRTALRDLAIAAGKAKLGTEQTAALLKRFNAAYPGLNATGALAGDVPGEITPEYFDRLVKHYQTPGLTQSDLSLIPALNTEKTEAALSKQNVADSGVMSAAKEAIHYIPGVTSGALAANQVLKFTNPRSAAVKFAGAIAGGMLGGYVGQETAERVGAPLIPDSVAEATGMTRDQLAINEAENPYWVMAGREVPNALLFRPSVTGSMYKVAPHLMGGSVNTAVDAGVQLASTGEIDLRQSAIAFGSGALFNDPNRIGRALGFHSTPFPEVEYRGVDKAPHVTYNQKAARAEFVNELAGKPFEGFADNSPIRNTPENAAVAQRVKALVDAGDTAGAIKEAQQLDVRKNNGLDAEQVTTSINNIAQGWSNAPEFVVHSAVDAATVPPKYGTVEPGTLGFFDRSDGKVHVFADQLVDESDVAAVAFHEALGHAGLAWKYRDGLNDLLIEMYKHGPKNFKAAVETWQAHPDNKATYAHIKDEKTKLAVEIEEVLAETSEHGPLKARMYDAIANYIKKTARKAGADHLAYSDREIRSILGTAHDTVIKGGNRNADAAGLGGIRYIYAGPKAQGADLAALEEAKRRPNQNEDQKDMTRLITGWHKGADEMWRWEIDDSTSALKQDVVERLKANSEETVYLEEAFKHPELFKNYPQLKALKLQIKPSPFDFGQRVQGWYDSGRKKIVLTPYADDFEGTILHELEHSVQDVEGFSPGGNDKTAVNSIPDDVAFRAVDTLSEYLYNKAKPIEDKRDAFALAREVPLIQELGALRQEANAAWDAYKAVQGTEEEPAASEAWNKLFKAAGKLKQQIAEQFFGKSYWKLNSSSKRFINELDLFAAQSPDRQKVTLNELDETIDTISRLIEHLQESKKAGDADAVREGINSIPDAGMQAYRALYGEVRARDVTARKNLTAEQRRIVRPLLDETEVAPDEYLFGKREGATPQEVSADPTTANEIFFSRRRTRNPGYEPSMEKFLDTHVGPELADKLHGLVKNLPQQRRVPDEETKANALELGLDLQNAVNYGAFQDHSDYVVALGDLLQDTAKTVTEQAKLVNNKGGAEAEAKLISSIFEFYQLADVFKNTASNLGRTFRALQVKIGNLGEDFSYEDLRYALKGLELGDGQEVTPEVIQKMAKKIAEGSPKEVLKQARRLDPEWKKYADSFYYNGMLSTAAVQWNNIRGNAWALWDDIVVSTLAAGVGKVRGLAAGQEAEKALFREVGRSQVGLFSALTAADTYKGVVREFTAPVGGAHKNKIQSQAIQNLPASLVIESGTRAMQAVDAFFRSAAEAYNMERLAFRQAANEATAKFGGEYGSHREYIERRIPEIMSAPSKELLKEVQRRADVLLLQEDPGEWVKKFSTGVRGIPLIGRLLLPFVNVTANDMRQAFEMTGLPATKRMLSKSSRRAGAELDRDIARAMLGWSLLPTIIMGAASGAIDGLGPSDPRERDQWIAGGHVPQTMVIPGVGRVSTKGLTGFGTMLTVLADTTQMFIREKSKLSRKEEDSYANLGIKTAGAFSSATLSNSFASTFLDIAKAPQGNVLEKLVLSAVGPFSKTPFLSEAEILSDEYQRDIAGKDFFDRVNTRARNVDDGTLTSGGRESLPIKVDSFGRMLKRVPEAPTDPIALETGRLFDSTGIVIVADRENTRSGRFIPTEIQNTWRMIEGPVIREALEKAMQDPRYPKMNDEQKARYLQKQVTRIRRVYGKGLDLRMVEREGDKYKEAMLPDFIEAFVDNPLPEE